MPGKNGVKTTSPKLVIVKEQNNELIVIQYNGSRYVVYTLNNSPGTSNASAVNDKGKMYSLFDFDVDGTMLMDMSFYDGSIVAENFYTALTSYHIGLNWVRYPVYEALPASPTNKHLKGSEGHVIQFNSVQGLSLGNRYTLFGDRFNPETKKFGWVLNHGSLYKKFYYGIVQDQSEGVLVENVQFKKALDFSFG